MHCISFLGPRESQGKSLPRVWNTTSDLGLLPLLHSNFVFTFVNSPFFFFDSSNHCWPEFYIRWILTYCCRSEPGVICGRIWGVHKMIKGMTSKEWKSYVQLSLINLCTSKTYHRVRCIWQCLVSHACDMQILYPILSFPLTSVGSRHTVSWPLLS